MLVVGCNAACTHLTATYPRCLGVVMSEIIRVVMTFVPDWPILDKILPAKYAGRLLADDIRMYGPT